jgi:hypothetical protein
MLTILAGLGEEFGWRGFAMPRLQARYNALVSSIIIGVLWGIWHIPLFLVEGTIQHDWTMDASLVPAVLGYMAFLIAWSIQYTWVFNNTKGSVLLAAVLHGAGNAWIGGYIDVYRGHFAGITTFMVVMVERVEKSPKRGLSATMMAPRQSKEGRVSLCWGKKLRRSRLILRSRWKTWSPKTISTATSKPILT